MRKSLLYVALVVMTIAFSCKDKVICPAFQSTYILDDSTRRAFYNPIMKLDKATRDQYLATIQKTPTDGFDSISMLATTLGYPSGESEAMLPYFAHAENYVQSPERVRKTKYGIIKHEPLWLKNYHLKSAPMENVLAPPKIDTTSVEEGEFVAGDFVGGDSTVTARLPLAKEEQEQQYKYNYRRDDKFNVEQEYYNKYFGKLFIDDRPPKQEEEEDPLVESDTTNTKKKGLKGLLKRKKPKGEEEEDAEELL